MNREKFIQSTKLASFIIIIFSLFLQFTAAENAITATIKNKNNQTLNVHGLAINRLLRQEIYFGVLYTGKPNLNIEELYSTSMPKRMSMKFIQDSFSARQFARLWKERIAINNHRNVWQPYSQEIIRFSNAMSHSFIKGDRLDIDYIPNDRIQVFVNDILFYESFKLEIYNLFLSSWVGDIPPTKDFKQGILGLVEEENVETLFIAYNAISTISGRIALPTPPTIIENQPPVIVVDNSIKTQEATPKVTPKITTKATPKLAQTEIKPIKIETVSNNNQQDIAVIKSENELEKSELNDTSAPEGKETNLVSAEPIVAEASTEILNPVIANGKTEYIDLDLMRGEYVRQLIDTIRKKQVFPSRAWRLGIFGDGIALIKVNAKGEIVNREIFESTGHKLLDKAILSLIDDSDKLPEMPTELKEEFFEFTLPISYSRS